MLPPMWPRPTKPIDVCVATATSAALLDGRNVSVVQLQVRGGQDGVDLVGMPEAGDGAVDRRVSERPCDRDGARGRVVPRSHPLEPLDESEVVRELRLAE